MRPLVALLAALLLIGSAGAAATTFQSDDYSMSSPGEVEIPARSLTVDGTDYTVRGIGRVAPGDRVRIDVTAPEDAEYSVYLYDKDLRIEQTDSMSGSGRATFDTDSLPPGSYLAAVYDGEILDVYPVVVEGYEVTVEAPATVEGSFAVNVSVADGALTRDPAQVQVVLGDDERSVRVDATRVGDGEYRATLPTDEFEPGTYALYGVVRGEEETEGGDQVILAVGDRYEIEIEAATPTPTATPGNGDGDGDGDGGGGGGDAGGGGGGQPGSGDDGEVTVESMELLNGTVDTAEPVVVRVDLANFDPAGGDTTLRLTTDGTVLAERTVSVGASAERTVYLRAVLDTAGTYPLALNGESLGSLTVTAAPTGTPTATAAPTPSPTATPTPTDEAVVTPRPTTATASPPSTTTSGDGAGFGVATAALAVALAALALGRRR